MDKRKIAEYSFRIAAVILVICAVMLFFVPAESAEFVILIVSMVLCAVIGVLSYLRIRRG